MKYPKNFVLLAAPFVGLVLFILFTDPYKLPLALVPVPFLLIGVGLYRSVRFISQRAGLTKNKSRLVAAIVTALVLLLGLLQSIHQLSIKDFLLLAGLLIGLTLYLRRIDF